MEERQKSRRAGQIILALVCGFMLVGVMRYAAGGISVSSNVNGRELPIRSVETEDRKVSLTFDVAWNSKDLDVILEILKKEGVRASFFITGEWAEKHPWQVRAIREDGHDLGNHTQSHESMTMLSEEERRLQIRQAEEAVAGITGIQMNLFRPPYGTYDDALILLAGEMGYETVAWNIDSQDWKDYGKDAILEEVLQNEDLENGAIILLHAGTRYLVAALPDLVEGIRKAGYEPVPLSELMLQTDYRLDVAGRQIPVSP